MTDWCFWELKQWTQIQAASTDAHVEIILYWPYPYFHRSFFSRFEALYETEKGAYLYFYVYFFVVNHILSYSNGVVGSYAVWLSSVCLFQDRGMDCHRNRAIAVPSLQAHFDQTKARAIALTGKGVIGAGGTAMAGWIASP